MTEQELNTHWAKSGYPAQVIYQKQNGYLIGYDDQANQWVVQVYDAQGHASTIRTSARALTAESHAAPR